MYFPHGLTLKIEDLDFGSIPPTIEIKDLTDPVEEFYECSDEEEEDPESISWAGTLQCSDSISIVGNACRLDFSPQTMMQSPSIESSVPSRNPLTEIEPLQLELGIHYHGDFKMTIKTELYINHPTSRFLVLPIRLTLKSLELDATAWIVYLQKSVQFCFVKSNLEDSIIQNIVMESEVGDGNKQVLKNLSKIEKFVTEQLVQFLDDYFVFPNVYRFQMENASDLF